MAMSAKLLRPRATGFNPKSISGLVAWFDADDASTFTLNGTAVSEWRDKSGNGYAVSQGTANNQPARTGTVGGRRTVDFNGVNSCLFSDNTGLSTRFSGDKSLTAFIVGQMHNSAEISVNALGTWFSLGSSESGTPFIYMRSSPGSGNGQIAIRNDASSATGQVSSAPGPAGDGVNVDTAIDSFICSATVPSQGIVAWRTHTIMYAEGDGIGNRSTGLQGSLVTASSARPAGTTTINRFTIGALGRNTFSDYFPARISQIVLYAAALNDADRAKVVKYLGKQYSFSTPVL